MLWNAWIWTHHCVHQLISCSVAQNYISFFITTWLVFLVCVVSVQESILIEEPSTNRSLRWSNMATGTAKKMDPTLIMHRPKRAVGIWKMQPPDEALYSRLLKGRWWPFHPQPNTQATDTPLPRRPRRIFELQVRAKLFWKTYFPHAKHENQMPVGNIYSEEAMEKKYKLQTWQPLSTHNLITVAAVWIRRRPKFRPQRGEKWFKIWDSLCRKHVEHTFVTAIVGPNSTTVRSKHVSSISELATL